MISIIVPIYNVRDYLTPCIKSILNSTYRNFELLLIDDGSTDGSGDICDECAIQDSRIRVIHKPNEGVSNARNTGLETANGQYVLFLDGDDVIHPNMIQVLFDAIQSGDYDFSMVYYMVVNDTEYKTMLADSNIGLNTTFKELTREDFMSGFLTMPRRKPQYRSVCNKLYRREFIADSRFVITAIEDMEFNFRLWSRMKKAVLIEENLYYYIQRKTSITHGGISRWFINRMESFKRCYDDIPKEFTDIQSRNIQQLYKVMLYTKHYAKGTTLSYEANSLSERIYQETKKDFWQSNLPWYKKQVLAFMLKAPSVYSLLLNVSAAIFRRDKSK